ncbi:hypothetical protein C5167_019284 [Papaver somniferum]|uniref:FAR1 domain-containing protein n=1 Tax=Papaver somniferum TaxID=3469 RepID=A0A4Y7IPQ3_PAPSO|nr:hypothetical protein C5167_019284 [Papaver somniferum]
MSGVSLCFISSVLIVNFEGYVSEDDGMILGEDLTVHEEDPVGMEMGADEDTKILIENSVGTLGSEDGEMVGISDGGDITVNELNGNNDEPHIGMEFESEEAAKIYYATYATRVGFITRVGNCHRSGRDNSVISRRFLCNKEGFRLNSNNIKRLEGRKPRAITREGCKAMIMVRKEKSGRWIITKLETEHSHPLGIPSNKNRRVSVQARPQDEKDKKIRELSAELHRANQQLADCRQQLDMILNDIEQHTNHLTKSVEKVVEQVKELEDEDQDYFSYHISN